MSSDTSARTRGRRLGVVLLAVLVAVSASAAVVSAAGDTTVSLSPSDRTVAPDATTTYDVVVQNTSGGVGAYTFTVSVDNASVGEITDVSLAGDPSDDFSSIEFADDNSSVEVNAVGADNTDSGEVAIATVTVRGAAEGTTDAELVVSALGDEDANSYTVTGTENATLTVNASQAPDAPVVGSNPAQDLDGDGLYEDVTGDGAFNIIDVGLFLQERNSDAVQNNADAFDFTGDGSVNIIDVGMLLSMSQS